MRAIRMTSCVAITAVLLVSCACLSHRLPADVGLRQGDFALCNSGRDGEVTAEEGRLVFEMYSDCYLSAYPKSTEMAQQCRCRAACSSLQGSEGRPLTCEGRSCNDWAPRCENTKDGDLPTSAATANEPPSEAAR